MSRVGKQPITIPSGVTVAVHGKEVAVKGPKGELTFAFNPTVSVAVDGSVATVTKLKDDRQGRADYGTTRSIINNMVVGVTDGYKRGLELHGVGYTAKLASDVLTLRVGYSHEVDIDIPKIVNCAVDGTKISLESPCKQTVGQVAARIRKVKPPEPYLGVGIRYAGEQVKRKAGKAGKK